MFNKDIVMDIVMDLDRIKIIEENSCFGCLLTNVEIPYHKMLQMLGEPNRDCDDYKTDVEWLLEFDGVSFYIYNYKDGINYCGSSGLPDVCLSDWHIGGKDKEKAIELANYLIDNEPNPEIDFPKVENQDIEDMIHRIRKMGYVEYIQVKNYLEEIGA